MKKTIKLTESELKKLIKETLSEIEQTEPRIMSDDDIKAQYDDMKILNFKLEKTNFGGWSGAFELEFPNADNIDYDDYTINNFIVYDVEGKRIAWDNWMPDEDTHRLEEIIRGEIAKRLSENNGMELNESIDELDWKTYANAAKKRFEQLDDPNVEGSWKEKFNKAYGLEKMANQTFDDEYIGDMKYDRMGDSLSGKHSPSFNGRFNVTNSNMPYGAINGTNKGGGKIFSTAKGVYHSGNGGLVKPGTFFRDKETANKYEKANNELWDYDNGAYTYEKGKGWRKKDENAENLDEAVKRAIRKYLK